MEDKLYRDRLAELPRPEAVIELDPARQGGFDGFTMAADRVIRDVQRGITDLFQDKRQMVTLPDEKAGTIMVFRAYDRISYALVMDAERPMHVLDSVKNP